MTPGTVLRSFATAVGPADVAVIEGNRGLYDGMDARGSYSTAELAKLLNTPVLLVVDCTKATRTVAAMVLGCQKLDPSVSLRGVILNNVAGRRHESVLREAVAEISGVPVVGALGRIPGQLFPERHLGLVPPQEHDQLSPAIQQAASVVEQQLDLAAIWDIARQAPALEPHDSKPTATVDKGQGAVRVGVFRDAAFQFYYPENLEALIGQGAILLEISPLRDTALPDVDALYLGGGFPETAAAALADNRPFLDSLRHSINGGLPVYAECGGAVFLGEKLLYDQREYPMAGVLPVAFSFEAKPQGHGYAVLETVENNPFFSVGECLQGHEFHYTYMQSSAEEDLRFAFRVRRGYGFDGQRDGLVYRNVLACYTHLHALGTESWAPSVVRAATKYKLRGVSHAGVGP
jgi:cobyrinic acid a,c-diamide synthase